MKGNTILASAVIFALAGAGAASAQDAQQCGNEASQLKLQLDASNLADSDRARLEDELSEAQHADLARCGQIVAQVKRELGAGADAAPDDYSSANDSSGAMTNSMDETPSPPADDADMAAPDGTSASTQQSANEQPMSEPVSGPSAASNAGAMAVLGTLSTDDVVDKPVHGTTGKKVGEIEAIVVDSDAAQPHGYAVISYGGLFGIGESEVLLDLDRLQLTANGDIQVPASDEDDFDAYPKYEKGRYQAYQGALSRLL